jgi:hypothetical protein
MNASNRVSSSKKLRTCGSELIRIRHTSVITVLSPHTRLAFQKPKFSCGCYTIAVARKRLLEEVLIRLSMTLFLAFGACLAAALRTRHTLSTSEIRYGLGLFSSMFHL